MQNTGGCRLYAAVVTVHYYVNCKQHDMQTCMELLVSHYSNIILIEQLVCFRTQNDVSSLYCSKYNRLIRFFVEKRSLYLGIISREAVHVLSVGKHKDSPLRYILPKALVYYSTTLSEKT